MTRGAPTCGLAASRTLVQQRLLLWRASLRVRGLGLADQGPARVTCRGSNTAPGGGWGRGGGCGVISHELGAALPTGWGRTLHPTQGGRAGNRGMWAGLWAVRAWVLTGQGCWLAVTRGRGMARGAPTSGLAGSRTLVHQRLLLQRASLRVHGLGLMVQGICRGGGAAAVVGRGCAGVVCVVPAPATQ
jgi:hypothetical protein